MATQMTQTVALSTAAQFIAAYAEGRGATLEPATAAEVAAVLAHMAEVKAKPRAKAEGMTKQQIFFKVVLLQVIKRILPSMGNEIITLVKDTSLARIIALQEIIWAGQAFMKGSQGISGAIWPLFFTGVYYLACNGLLTLLFGWVERKLSYYKV